MVTFTHDKERGQTLVLVTLMILVFIGILALVLDGGAAYASRRKAQNAADAGAMAGASYLCPRSDTITSRAEAGAEARNYAVNLNGASDAEVIVGETKTVTVTASVNYPTPFATFWGSANSTASARAVAGCFPVCSAKNIVPVAWSCDALTHGEECQVNSVEYGNEFNPPLYLVMDTSSLSVDLNCKYPPNSSNPGIDCDLNDDGADDVIRATSDRSFLNMDGGASASAAEMKDWIENGFPDRVYTHRWYPTGAAVDASVFMAAETFLEGELVMLPVYDRMPCEIGNGGSIASTCPTLWDTGDTQPWNETNWYVHISQFAPFRVTCVQTGPGDNPKCKAYQDFIDQNSAIMSPGDRNKLRTIEGYFVRGHIPEMDKCPAGTGSGDFGAWTVSLIN